MLNFVVIGLICNSLGCYWVRVDGLGVFVDQQRCAIEAEQRKQNSMMYFATSCLVVRPNMDK